MRTNETEFAVKTFQSPGRDYAPCYAWVWNGPLCEQKIDSQLAEMDRLGIRMFYIIPEPQTFRPTVMPTRLDPNYLTPEYFRYYKYALDRAKEYNMECWIYDEGGWPSGGACGRVLFEYPEYAKRSLQHSLRQYKAGERYCKEDNDMVSFYDGNMIDDGYVFETDAEISVYGFKISAWENPSVPDYPDLTVKEATQAFLHITHEQYKAFLGEHFGNTLTAVFTDEPKAPSLPFREELCQMYQEEYGESILPHLPVLAGNVPLNEENIEYKRRWYDLCSRVYCENYLLECKKWSNENGMKFTGHLDNDNHPMGCLPGAHFHIMRGLRCMDIPGVDVIWRQIFPGVSKDIYIGGYLAGKEAENRFFPRFASSAAAQTGNVLAMTESFGVYGYGLTYEQMRYVLGFQAIRGVTKMNLMVVTYDRTGYTMSQEAPGFAETQGCHRDLAHFNRYIERLSYVCTCGTRICDTALYYPINDFWGELHATELSDAFENLGHSLEMRGIDFDICDDDIILQAPNIGDGVIESGIAQYRRIVIPANAYLSSEIKMKLEQFRMGGGVVITDADALRADVEIIGGDGNIRVMKRLVNGCDYICLFNESITAQKFAVNIESRRGYFVDITLGELHKIQTDENGLAFILLESGETCALYLTDERLTTSSDIINTNQIQLDSPYTFRRIDQFILGKLHPEYNVLDEEAIPAKLGEWSTMTGCDFTGSGMYTTHFRASRCNAILDLGDVRHSCEVFINGHSVGIRMMKPYRFYLPAEVMHEENLLEIRVSNTPGNQHQYTKTFDKYKPWQLSAYREAQNIFDRDSLDSGLFGPITLTMQ